MMLDQSLLTLKRRCLTFCVNYCLLISYLFLFLRGEISDRFKYGFGMVPARVDSITSDIPTFKEGSRHFGVRDLKRFKSINNNTWKLIYKRCCLPEHKEALQRALAVSRRIYASERPVVIKKF